MRRPLSYLLLLFASFAALLAVHAPLLQLPYYWDEAGYYIPAAYDVFTKGQLIPTSTLTNAHPPLVMAYLALAWKVFGYSPLVTRTAMLLVAAFGLVGLFFLAKAVSNNQVAAATVVCTAVYPVFFAQSSMAHVDLAAAALTFWALGFYFRQRLGWAAGFFALAVLAKETAIITPFALVAWEFIGRNRLGGQETMANRWRRAVWLLVPAILLGGWFTYHYLHTGFVFGNPVFFQYNVGATLHPVRFLFALIRRLWQLFGHMNLYVLTIAAALAMMFPATRQNGRERQRIPVPVQLPMAAVVLAHALAFSLVGGAALARYLLPAVPLVILICVSTIWRRIRGWQLVIALVGMAFAAGLFINPPYVFAPEDNLSYRDYVALHQEAARALEQQFPAARVLTAWPGSDELAKPYLGYVGRQFTVIAAPDFSHSRLEIAVREEKFDVAFVFSTKYEPPRRLWQPRFWEEGQRKFFDYRHDLPPEAVAQLLGGEIVYEKQVGGHWVAIIRMQKVENASMLSGTK